MSFLSFLRSRFRRPRPPTPVEFPDAQNLEEYIAMFPTLAQRLGSGRTSPTPLELEFLRKVLATELPPGNVGRGNLFFLAAVVSAFAPRHALEVGTASGASTAVLASLIALAHGAASGDSLLVDTIHVNPHSLFHAT